MYVRLVVVVSLVTFGYVLSHLIHSGVDYEFEEQIVGGVVPKEYHSAVDKGIQERMKNGVLAGYPVVGVKATLYDGSYHDVDSDELSFKMAGSMAFKKGFMAANPALLEPVMKVEVGDARRLHGRHHGRFEPSPWYGTGHGRSAWWH